MLICTLGKFFPVLPQQGHELMPESRILKFLVGLYVLIKSLFLATLKDPRIYQLSVFIQGAYLILQLILTFS